MTARMRMIALAAALAAGAASAQTLDATGSSMGDNESRVFPIGPEHVAVLVMAEYDRIEALDSSSPMNGLSGPCFGLIDSDAGVVSGGGYCALVDETGAKASLRWTARTLGENSKGGDWELIGGTGKWDGATGSGQFQFVSDAATQRFSTSMTGEVSLR